MKTLLVFLAALGMPLFAAMGGLAALAWLDHESVEARAVRLIAPNVLADQFASSAVLVTIPLFTFAGYLLAESKAPFRLVRAATAAVGWMPGGLAIVCIFANAFFTTMTGGSGVTIVAIGGLMYPALLKQGYPQKYALGLVTAAGAVGLLFFPSPLVGIYSFIAGIDMTRTYKATAVPGIVLMGVLIVHAIWVGVRSKVPRAKFDLRELGEAMWEVKWEALAPILVGVGMFTGLMDIDEAAACVVLFVFVTQIWVHGDLKLGDVRRIATEAISLAGAIILILVMATALTNYLVDARIPFVILEWMTARGVDTFWEFILILNIFLFILGVVMDEFSAMLVALPLVMPLAARFGLSPFHLAVMFLVNIEIAYISPPIGINLYIASFRFNKPVTEIYRVVMPFVWLFTVGLGIFILLPKISTFTVEGQIAEARAEAEKKGVSPRDAWLLECVQMDQNNPRPCTPEDIAKWGEDGQKMPEQPAVEDEPKPAETSAATTGGGNDPDALLREMMGEGPAPSATPSAAPSSKPLDNDALLKEMMGE